MSLPSQLETERLCMRQITEQDAETLHRAILASSEVLAPWVEWLTPTPTLEERVAFTHHVKARFDAGEELTLGLWVKASGKYAGTLSVVNIIRKVPKAGIGYWGNAQTSGQGYISEALRTVAAHFLTELDFKRLWLTCDANNIASQRVAEHAGFSREAVMKNERLNNQGALSDTYLYARTPA